MRSFKRYSKGLFTAGVLAASVLGLGACGPDYALFRVDVTSTKSPRNNIEECHMTITDENGAKVLDQLPLKTVSGPADTSGNPTLLQGCQGGLTNSNIGSFSYSSSRTGGTLTFQVDAWDNNGQQCGFTGVAPCLPVQTGNSGPIAPAKYPPEVPVTIAIK